MVVIITVAACVSTKKSTKAPDLQQTVNDSATIYSALTLKDLEGLTPEQVKGLQVYISHRVTMSRTEPYRTKEVRNGILYWVDSNRLVTKTINEFTKGQITVIKNPGSPNIELATSFDKEDKALTLKFYSPNDGTSNLVLVMADDHIAIRDGFKYEVSTLATETDKCKLLFIGKGGQGSSTTTITAKGNPVGNTTILKSSQNSNIVLPSKPVRDSM